MAFMNEVLERSLHFKSMHGIHGLGVLLHVPQSPGPLRQHAERLHAITLHPQIAAGLRANKGKWSASRDFHRKMTSLSSTVCFTVVNKHHYVISWGIVHQGRNQEHSKKRGTSTAGSQSGFAERDMHWKAFIERRYRCYSLLWQGLSSPAGTVDLQSQS